MAKKNLLERVRHNMYVAIVVGTSFTSALATAPALEKHGLQIAIFTVATSGAPDLCATRQRKPMVRITPTNSRLTMKRGSRETLGSFIIVSSAFTGGTTIQSA